jgi:hypothetical protein
MPRRVANVIDWYTEVRRARERDSVAPHRIIRIRTDEGGIVLAFGGQPAEHEQFEVWGTTTEGGWEVNLPAQDYKDILHLLQTEEPIKIMIEKNDDMQSTFFNLSTGRDVAGGGFTDS